MSDVGDACVLAVAYEISKRQWFFHFGLRSLPHSQRFVKIFSCVRAGRVRVAQEAIPGPRHVLTWLFGVKQRTSCFRIEVSLLFPYPCPGRRVKARALAWVPVTAVHGHLALGVQPTELWDIKKKNFKCPSALRYASAGLSGARITLRPEPVLLVCQVIAKQTTAVQGMAKEIRKRIRSPGSCQTDRRGRNDSAG